MKNRRKNIRKNYKKYHSVYHRRRRLNRKRIAVCSVLLTIIAAMVITGVSILISKDNKSVEVVQNNVNPKEGESFKTESETKKQKIKPIEVSIIAVGDNLVSDSVLATAKRNGGGSLLAKLTMINILLIIL